jgi:hypothetical protein
MRYTPQSFRQETLAKYAPGTSARSYVDSHIGNEFDRMTSRWDKLISYDGCLNAPLVYRLLGWRDEYLRCGQEGIALANRYISERKWHSDSLHALLHAKLDVYHLSALVAGKHDTPLLYECYDLLIGSEQADWRIRGRYCAIRRAILLLALGDPQDAVAVISRPRSFKDAEHAHERVLEFARAAASGTISDSTSDMWLDYFDLMRERGDGKKTLRVEKIRNGLYFQQFVQVSLELALITHRYIYSKGEINYEAAADLVFS